MKRLVSAAALVAMALAQSATAQTTYPDRSMGSADPARNIVLDARPDSIRVLPPVRLYPAGGGGFRNWPGRVAGATEIEREGNLFNVSDPSYQAFLPSPERNTRTAVIVAPGGGFRMLTMGAEGNDVARWLAARGIAAFVLKYRLVQQAGSNPTMMGGPRLDFGVAGQPGVADGTEAIRQIRARAAEYGIDADRIVFIGFSAGGHVASYQALNSDVAARPNYVANIYGGPLGDPTSLPPRYLPGTMRPGPSIPGLPPLPATGTPNPAALPPMFFAVAQDDFVLAPVRRFYDALIEAGYQPEAHFFVNGLHGYGINETRSSSRHFIEQFYWWLETLGLTRKPGDPDLAMPHVDLEALINGNRPPAQAQPR